MATIEGSEVPAQVSQDYAYPSLFVWIFKNQITLCSLCLMLRLCLSLHSHRSYPY